MQDKVIAGKQIINHLMGRDLRKKKWEGDVMILYVNRCRYCDYYNPEGGWCGFCIFDQWVMYKFCHSELEFVDHTPNCPIFLHRALMKELRHG